MAQLQSANALLQAQIGELTTREQRLSASLREAHFENTQQARQIAALASAPAQRDQYKKQLDKMVIRNYRLEQELLRSRPRPLPPSTRPASRPATPLATQPAATTRPAATPPAHPPTPQ